MRISIYFEVTVAAILETSALNKIRVIWKTWGFVEIL